MSERTPDWKKEFPAVYETAYALGEGRAPHLLKAYPELGEDSKAALVHDLASFGAETACAVAYAFDQERRVGNRAARRALAKGRLRR